jgi:hypothetical protein
MNQGAPARPRAGCVARPLTRAPNEPRAKPAPPKPPRANPPQRPTQPPRRQRRADRHVGARGQPHGGADAGRGVPRAEGRGVPRQLLQVGVDPKPLPSFWPFPSFRPDGGGAACGAGALLDRRAAWSCRHWRRPASPPNPNRKASRPFQPNHLPTQPPPPQPKPLPSHPPPTQPPPNPNPLPIPPPPPNPTPSHPKPLPTQPPPNPKPPKPKNLKGPRDRRARARP